MDTEALDELRGRRVEELTTGVDDQDKMKEQVSSRVGMAALLTLMSEFVQLF